MTSAHTGTATDQLRQAYKNVLLQIYHDLNREHLRRLRRCCTGCISKQDAETVTIFRCLEHEGKISWENVKFLKELMGTMQRLDIVKKLTEFEVKRDLTILLDFYARKRNGSDLRCCSVSVKKLAGYLTRIADIVRDNVDLSSLNITVETSKDIRKALVDFEEEIDCRAELMFSWNEFTMLVVIAGELTVVSSESRQSEPFMELCSTAADELCSRMIELGSWEEFCDQVKEKYHLVYHRQNLDAKPSLTSQKQRAEVVQRLMEGIFFPQDHFKDAFLCTYC